MDAGSVAVSSYLTTDSMLLLILQEFDNPYNLYQNGELFREMCDRSNVTLKDIEMARVEANNLYHALEMSS